MPNLPSEIEFCALLSYATFPTTDDEKRAKAVSLDLKQGKRYGNPPQTICQRVAQRVLDLRDSPEFLGFFGPDVLAIPIPSSSLKQPGSLRIPYELGLALREVGLVGEVLELAERMSALPKSAASLPGKRSKAIDHFNTVQVTKKLIAPSWILLVDDVITRGATMLGIAGRVMEAYPGIPVLGFAAMRALSQPDPFVRLVDPCRGRVSLSGDQTFRRP